MTRSRTATSARNALVSLFAQLVLLALGIVARAVFVAHLGIELSGVDALFVSVLAVVGLADVGLSAAVAYSLYQPLRDGDEDRVTALVEFLARMYRFVAVAVLCAGGLLLPFLDRLANTSRPVEGLKEYFAVLLVSVAANYLFASRLTLLIADEKVHLTKLWGLAFNGARIVLQILAIVLFDSYLVYVLLQASATIGYGIYTYRRAGDLYPCLRRPGTVQVSSADRKTLYAQVRAMLVIRISGVAINNTSAILAVGLLGAAVGGRYANYLLIVGSVTLVLEVAFSALTPSVGHHVIAAGAQAKAVFEEMQLLAAWIYGACAVGFAVTLDDLVRIWVGADYVMAREVSFAVAANFLVLGLMMPVFTFRQATGMFRDIRYLLLACAALNVALGVAFAQIWGVAGIAAATVVARVLTSIWVEPRLLYRRHFGARPGGYFARQVAHLGAIGVSLVLALQAAALVDTGGLVEVLVVGAISVGVVTVVFALFFGRTREGRALPLRVRSILRR
ncbi:MAG: polysaccharide biosynthesis C-terminal domain-containing protein [Propionibacteriales bacterium]|nr:polysaccharide biosynthesis C-terminal domain-containing protein [Propionibacteriales bacterium]